MDKIKYKCLLCGRDNFDRHTSHYCVGGYRKHKIKWVKFIKTERVVGDNASASLPTSRPFRYW